MLAQVEESAPSGAFRKHLPDLSIPRFTSMKTQNAHEYAKVFKEQKIPPWLHALYEHWLELLREPFKGVTNDGNVRSGQFQLRDEGVPIETITAAAESVFGHCDPGQRQRLILHIDSPEWRTWSNPEFLLSHKGLRLDELDCDLRDAILHVLKSTLSPEGYKKTRSAMQINHYLGELVDSPAVCNEFSYNFVIFGSPSVDRPWGYSFYGHHLCLNVFFYKCQIVISPWFTGAEPNEVDQGPFSGTRILTREERLGLQLMQSLPRNLQGKARIFEQMVDPKMPPGRWNKDDQRHLCGAYRDNRIVPYEGIKVTEMAEEQKSLVSAIFEEYLMYLPQRARGVHLDHILSFASETYFCWIGGFGDDDPFYYRIQSPVIIVEFDHHSGVFLTNQEPAKFHIHTLLRTPNGGDYGYALRPLIPAVEQKFINKW
ncbi:MAG: hypothetical protein Q9227_005617 [Pyrenula ochraceoflavens]